MKCPDCETEVDTMGRCRCETPHPAPSAASANYGQWQLIETAPLDCNRYLFVTEGGIMRIDHLHQSSASQLPGRRIIRYKEYPSDKYTHWMPLPEKP